MLLSSGLGVIRCCLTKTKDMWVNFRGIPEPPGLNDITIQRVNSFELRRYRHNVADLLDSWNIYICHPYSGIVHV